MNHYTLASLLCTAVAAAIACPVHAIAAKKGGYVDPEVAKKADPDFFVQGEYVGKLDSKEGPVKTGTQVIALGGGKFMSVTYAGGLPGGGWDKSEVVRVAGERKGDVVRFETKEAVGVIEDAYLSVTLKEGNKKLGTLEKIERQSPTLGKEPPKGAVVLFDGTGTEKWQPGKMSEDNLLMQGATSKPKFQSHTLHIEFRLPYQPTARGQGRGNSGIYVQGRYEVQMLDSFGLEGKSNECGGIYSIKDPDVNMCLPPLSWQTYDIDFTAAKFDESGKMTAKPRMTVRHNGVVIHDDVELPNSTRAAPLKAGPQPGPVYLQNHGNPVRYRNIWVLPKQG